METIQQLDEVKLLGIKFEALEFVKANIGKDDFMLILDLKRELLIALESQKQLREHYIKQLERSEEKYAERVEIDLKAQAELVDAYEDKLDIMRKQLDDSRHLIVLYEEKISELKGKQ